jgi:hypothetical protein
MTIDISDLLTFLALSQWDQTTAMSLAVDIAESSNLNVRHDIEAGEEWICLLRQSSVFGLVHTNRRFIVVEPTSIFSVRTNELMVLLSTQLSAQVLLASTQALQAAFPSYQESLALTEPFSFDDLWFATV